MSSDDISWPRLEQLVPRHDRPILWETLVGQDLSMAANALTVVPQIPTNLSYAETWSDQPQNTRAEQSIEIGK